MYILSFWMGVQARPGASEFPGQKVAHPSNASKVDEAVFSKLNKTVTDWDSFDFQD
jgi:hypothetical protein